MTQPNALLKSGFAGLYSEYMGFNGRLHFNEVIRQCIRCHAPFSTQARNAKWCDSCRNVPIGKRRDLPTAPPQPATPMKRAEE
jgi:hypothetical protein